MGIVANYISQNKLVNLENHSIIYSLKNLQDNLLTKNLWVPNHLLIDFYFATFMPKHSKCMDPAEQWVYDVMELASGINTADLTRAEKLIGKYIHDLDFENTFLLYCRSYQLAYQMQTINKDKAANAVNFFAEKLESLVKNGPARKLTIPNCNEKFNKELILANLKQRKKSFALKVASIGLIVLFVPAFLDVVQMRQTEDNKLSQQKFVKQSLLDYAATQAPIHCAGNSHLACQTALYETFSQALTSRDIHKAEDIAFTCVRHEDESCQRIVSETFSKLTPEKNFRAENFAISCIGQPGKSCQAVVKVAFSKLLETQPYPSAAVRFAINCLGKPDEGCQATVNTALTMLLEKEELAAAERFTLASIGKTIGDKECVNEFYKAIRMFYSQPKKTYCTTEFMAGCHFESALEKNPIMVLLDEHC